MRLMFPCHTSVLLRLAILIASACPAARAQAAFSVDAEYAAQPGLGSIKAASAYQLGLSGAGVRIGIVDSGINPGHQEFAGAIAAGFNYFSGGPLGDSSAIFHGSHVAGVVGARRDGVGMMGVAWGSDLVIGATDYSLDQLALAIDFTVGAGARGVNNSWGISGSTVVDYDRATVEGSFSGLVGALGRAVAADAVVVFANGNEGFAQPQLFGGLPFLIPEFQRNWITVIAANIAGTGIPSYANRCGVAAQWCIAAPGGFSGDAGVYSVDGATTDGYKYLKGSSNAAPFATGAIALIAERFPWMTGEQLAATMLTTATRGTDAVLSATFGRGLIDLDKAMRGPAALEFDWRVDTGGLDATWSNNIIGSGALVKHGEGVLTLAGNNSFGGGVTLAGGAVRIAADAGLGAAGGGLVFDGGRLEAGASLALARNVTVADGGGSLDTGAFTVTLTGSLLGSGQFAKQGSGTLLLTGDGGFSGTTHVQAGTLAGTAASLSGVISGAGTLVVDSEVAASARFLMDGIARLEKRGAGSLTLGPTLPLQRAGEVVVEGGLLQLETGLAGNVRVQDQAALALKGSVDGDVVVDAGGVLLKGAAVPATISGDLGLAAGALLNLEVDGGAATPLTAGGVVDLAGARLQVDIVSALPALSRLGVLQAASVSGRFDRLVMSPGLTARLQYEADAVDLILSRTDDSLLSRVVGANRRAAAAGLRELLASGYYSDTLAARINAVYAAPAASAARALDTLSGEAVANMVPAMQNMLSAAALSPFLAMMPAEGAAATASTFTADGAAMAQALPAALSGRRDGTESAWVQLARQQGRAEESVNAGGYDSQWRLLSMGVDRETGTGARLGVMLAQGELDVARASAADRADATLVLAGLYARWPRGRYEWLGTVQAGRSEGERLRQVDTGAVATRALSAGRDDSLLLALGVRAAPSRAGLRPLLLAQWLTVDSAAARESGSAALDLYYPAQRRQFTQAAAGVQWQPATDWLSPRLTTDLLLLWRHDFSPASEYATTASYAAAPVAGFLVTPAGIAQDRALLQGRAAYGFASGWRAALRLSAEEGEGAGMAGIALEADYRW